MKQIDRRWLSVGRDPRHVLKKREQDIVRSDQIFELWVAGRDTRDLARKFGISPDDVRKRIGAALRRRKCHYEKWKAAEANCRKLAMALRLARLMAAEAVPDQPIENLKPTPRWLKHFHNAGVMTVNQLRTVDSETLLANYRFDAGALYWAVMTLDKLGLSHVLRRPGALYKGG